MNKKEYKKEYMKVYKVINKEKIRAASREYRKKNAERIKEYHVYFILC